MESFKELRNFQPIRDAESELKFTRLLRHIYHRHRQGPAASRFELFISAKVLVMLQLPVCTAHVQRSTCTLSHSMSCHAMSCHAVVMMCQLGVLHAGMWCR